MNETSQENFLKFTNDTSERVKAGEEPLFSFAIVAFTEKNDDDDEFVTARTHVLRQGSAEFTAQELGRLIVRISKEDNPNFVYQVLETIKKNLGE